MAIFDRQYMKDMRAILDKASILKVEPKQSIEPVKVEPSGWFPSPEYLRLEALYWAAREEMWRIINQPARMIGCDPSSPSSVQVPR